MISVEKIKTTFILLFIVFNSVIFSQTERTSYFTYIDSTAYSISSVLELNDRYLYTTFNGTTASSTIRQINKKGEFIAEDSLTFFPNASFLTQLIKTSSGYVMAFSKHTDFVNQSYEFTDVIVRNFNHNHELLFETEIVSTHEDILIKFIQTNDNGFLVLSNKFITSITPSSTKMFLTKLNENGVIEWEKIIEEASSGITIVELETNNFYVMGYNYLTSSFQYEIIDDDGEVIQSSSFNHYLSPTISSVLPLNSSELMLIGSCKTTPTSDVPQGVMLKMNVNGTILDSNYYNFDEATQFLGAIKNHNNNYTIVGGEGIGTSLFLNPNYHRKPVICEINENGDVLWKKNYPIENELRNYFSTVSQTKDNGYIVSGSILRSNPTSYLTSLYKLDCIGCDSLTCYYKDSICNPIDCQRYANDYNYNVTIDSTLLELNKINVSIVNTTELNSLTWDFGDGNSSPASILTPSFDYLYDQAGFYEIKLIFSKGICSDTNKISLFVGAGLGLSEKTLSKLLIYPNPNNGTFNLKHNFPSGSNLKIHSLSNKIIYENENIKPIEEIQLLINSGIYIVTIESKGEIFKEKIVVR
jgi:hypothetical protein